LSASLCARACLATNPGLPPGAKRQLALQQANHTGRFNIANNLYVMQIMPAGRTFAFIASRTWCQCGAPKWSTESTERSMNTQNVKMLKPVSLVVAAVAMTFSLAAVAGPYDYDSSVGFESQHECGSGDNTRLISTSDVTSGGSNASNCFGAYDGNINAQTLIWGDKSWNRIDKIERSGSDPVQSSSLITLTFSDGENGLADGTWTFTGDYSSWDSFFITTKASNSPGWAAYYFDANALPASGDLTGSFVIPWTPNDNNRGGLTDLSHFSIYASNTASVPEPATLGLLGLGLMGIAGLRRRQQ